MLSYNIIRNSTPPFPVLFSYIRAVPGSIATHHKPSDLRSIIPNTSPCQIQPGQHHGPSAGHILRGSLTSSWKWSSKSFRLKQVQII